MNNKDFGRVWVVLILCLFFLVNKGWGQCVDEFEVSSTEKIYIFRCDGQFEVPAGFVEAEVLIVAGGGGGGYGTGSGGGGAGELIYENNMILTEGATYEVKVGAGGAGSADSDESGENGGNSSFNGFTADGGGGGGTYSGNANIRNGKDGGSGGGGAANTGANSHGQGGQAIGENGYNGGDADGNPIFKNGAGGGGAGVKGDNAPDSGNGEGQPNGGAGLEYSITGSDQIYAGGGGGNRSNGQNGDGGSGIGGDGNSNGVGSDGAPNTGSGGGAGFTGGGNGADGIVVIRLRISFNPVEWVGVNANFNQENKTVDINWSTLEEWESSHFEIERSINGVDGFEKIGELESAGWSDQKVDYQYKDKDLSVQGGWMYYRLKQVDLDGTFDYSETFAVKVPAINSGEDVWRIYPNPFQGEDLKVALMDGEAYQGEQIKVNIVSASYSVAPFVVQGKEKLSQKLYELLSRANPGLYVIQLHWSGQVQNLKVLKR